ncbi:MULTISPECIES: hypothetical protein [unclassified Alcanivorax]|jgi:hypothetical protein|uniref:hypothetical protein n=1 Tax=unclassified Alcanivorax TaxID=2638842 RepID=UPI0011AFE249|nr:MULTISPECIES: hypothetical protein [unclassified Alcanivorax]MEE3387955.1 hypothetical protein [Pseudomonadota bacterium]|tara:strand:+ start:4063 stop:4374 length:312 start_codon:yes stop_codon:yes gene_type:complete
MRIGIPDLVGLIEMNKSSFCGCKASFLISALLSIIWVEKDNLVIFFVLLFGLFVAVNEVLSFLTDRPMYLMTSQIPGEGKLSLERVVSFILHLAVIVIAIVIY